MPRSQHEHTVIIPTGGMEQNGPYLTARKHNHILKVTCEAIARKESRSTKLVSFRGSDNEEKAYLDYFREHHGGNAPGSMVATGCEVGQLFEAGANGPPGK